MVKLSSILVGFMGMIGVVMFISAIIMWFSVPIMLYQILQKVTKIEEKCKK